MLEIIINRNPTVTSKNNNKKHTLEVPRENPRSLSPKENAEASPSGTGSVAAPLAIS